MFITYLSASKRRRYGRRLPGERITKKGDKGRWHMDFMDQVEIEQMFEEHKEEVVRAHDRIDNIMKIVEEHADVVSESMKAVIGMVKELNDELRKGQRFDLKRMYELVNVAIKQRITEHTKAQCVSVHKRDKTELLVSMARKDECEAILGIVASILAEDEKN